MARSRQPWLVDWRKETILILSPALLPVALVIVFRDYFVSAEVSTYWWVLLVLFVDVSHVYSTLFRMYWEKDTFRKFRRHLIIIPMVGFAIAFLLHLYDSFLFWRVLAYVAVFHFVRQQYGFVRLYSRREPRSKVSRVIDALAIYNATLYPLLFWHVFATGELGWFIKGDFIAVDLQNYFQWFTFTYILIILVYIIKEIRFAGVNANIPKNLIVLGTYASWYVGIVMFQGDLIFTLLNVVAHGIPYMGLVWIYGERKSTSSFSFTIKGVLIFVGILITLAYLEEYLWDGFVWKEHTGLFPGMDLTVSHPVALSGIVALLILPQVTHYVLDGFIWKISKPENSVS